MNKKKVRPKSSVSSRELWLLAMKEGKTGTNLNRKPGAGLPQKQGIAEYWSNSLRRSGEPQSHKPVDSFSNLHNVNPAEVPFLSTSHYLRQNIGVEKTTPRANSNRGGPGTPAYKTPEEYYEDILALKKDIQDLKNDISNLKSKNRRLEEESSKKEKQLESLIDPSKNAELRRALSDKTGESAIVIQSLKQRIFKLEQQVKERDATVTKLQSDIKYTKTEEMKTQLEVLYKEIIRMRHAPAVDLLYSAETTKKEELVGDTKVQNEKVEALSKNLRKINEEKTMLATENNQLKLDLESLKLKVKDYEDGTEMPSEYADMSQKQLLSKIRMLEMEADRLKVKPASDKDVALRKAPLSGNIREKVEILDRRETELLGELAVKDEKLKKLAEERDSYKVKFEEQKKKVDRVEAEKVDLAEQLEKGLSGRSNFSRTSSADISQRKTRENEKEKPVPTKGKNGGQGNETAVTKLQAVLRGHKTRQDFLLTQSDDDEDKRDFRAPKNRDREESISGRSSRYKRQTSQESNASTSTQPRFAREFEKEKEKEVSARRASSASVYASTGKKLASREAVPITPSAARRQSSRTVAEDSDDDDVVS